MQRRKLSSVGVRRQRIGRKTIATARVATSIERRVPTVTEPKKHRFSFPSFHYTFRRWHAFAALAVVLSIIGSSALYMQRAQAEVAAKAHADVTQKAAVAQQRKQQACIADVVSKKQDQLGKVTYDGLCQ